VADNRVDAISGAQLRGSEEQPLDLSPTGGTTVARSHAAMPNLMDFCDDDVRACTYVEKEMRRARIMSPLDTVCIVERLATILGP